MASALLEILALSCDVVGVVQSNPARHPLQESDAGQEEAYAQYELTEVVRHQVKKYGK